MKVLRRGPEGEPREVELTEAEQVVKEIFDVLLDQGHNAARAEILLRGVAIPESLRTPTPALDAVLTTEFMVWLVW